MEQTFKIRDFAPGKNRKGKMVPVEYIALKKPAFFVENSLVGYRADLKPTKDEIEEIYKYLESVNFFDEYLDAFPSHVLFNSVDIKSAKLTIRTGGRIFIFH